jgi:hypothetical protein
VQLVEVEGVDALLGPDQNVLVVSLGVDPRRRAVDAKGATVENLKYDEFIANRNFFQIIVAANGVKLRYVRRRDGVARQLFS